MTTLDKPGRMLYDDILHTYLAALPSEVGPTTTYRYGGIIRRAHRDLPHGVIVATEDELRAWLWRPGRAVRTTAQYLAAIKHLHKWLHRREITTLDPSVLLKSPDLPKLLPRPVPRQQLDVLLAQAREPMRTWCWIIAHTGARCCEVATLDRQDMTPEAVRLYGKGGKERVIPMHPALWRIVEPLPPGLVVSAKSQKPAALVSMRIGRECARLGLAGVTAHRLRHTIATEVLAKTRDLRLVQDLLGHASPATTAIYTQVIPARMAAAITALDWSATANEPEGDPPPAGPIAPTRPQ